MRTLQDEEVERNVSRVGLWRKTEVRVNPHAVLREDVASKRRMAEEFKLDPQDRDFAFVLRRLNNTANDNGQITLATVPTAIFKRGKCVFFVVTDSNKHNSKLKFITDPTKIFGYGIEKIFCEKQSQDLFRHPHQEASRIREARKNTRISLIKQPESTKLSHSNIENRSVLTGRR